MSAELAPGLYVTDLAPPGQAFVLRPAKAFMFAAWEGPERLLVVSPADWEKIPAAVREEVLDWLVRQDAERGLEVMEDHLRSR